MFRLTLLFVIISFIQVVLIESLDESENEIATATPRRTTKTVSIISKKDDAIFKFIKKMLNTVQLSSKMALKRARDGSEKTRRFKEEVDSILKQIDEQNQ